MNLFYTVLNINKNFLMNIFLILLITISFFLTSFLFNIDYINRKNINQSNKLLNKASFYFFYQVLPYDKISDLESISYKNNKEELDKISEALTEASNKIRNSGIAKMGLLRPSSYYIKEIENDKAFYSAGVLKAIEHEDIVGKYDIYRYGFNSSILMDENVSEYMTYALKEGRNFKHEDYLKKNINNFSVIVGNNYNKYFNLGDKINAYYNNIQYTFDIVGILEKDTAVLSLVNTLTPINGNNSMIIAYDYTNDEIGVPNDVHEQGTVIITNNVGEVEKLIRDTVYNNVETLHEFGLSSISGLTEDIKWIHNEVTSSFRIMAVAFNIFTLIAIVISIYKKIKKDIYRMGVFILCGAKKKDIIKQLSYEKFLIIIFSSIASSIVSIIIKLNYISILLILCMEIILMIFTFIIIYLSLRKITVTEAVRRLE